MGFSSGKAPVNGRGSFNEPSLFRLPFSRTTAAFVIATPLPSTMQTPMTKTPNII